MTPEHQIVAIAEAYGFRECWISQNGAPWGFLGANYYSQLVPNYPFDLNAMHEVEKVLTPEQLVDYCAFRLRATTGEGCVTDYKMIRATASQRAEAFLRTIGKWEEAK